MKVVAAAATGGLAVATTGVAPAEALPRVQDQQDFTFSYGGFPVTCTLACRDALVGVTARLTWVHQETGFGSALAT